MLASCDTVKISSERLAGDLETPVSAYLKLSAAFGAGFLLESVQGGATRGRYSVLGFLPDLVFRADENGITTTRDEKTKKHEKPFFDTLRGLLDESRFDVPEDLPPMAAGIFGVIGYEAVRDIEKIGMAKPDPLELPKAILMRPRLIVIFDNVRDEIIVVVIQRGAPAEDLLNQAISCLRKPISMTSEKTIKTKIEAKSSIARSDYLGMVAKGKEYIAAGDVFQVVLSQRFETDFNLPPFALYRALRRTNPSPYLFYFDFEDFALAGSSPEICVQLRGDRVTLRPIAGTIRRGVTPAEDRINGEKLLGDQKERAEHLMLLDLGRNDVGRVAELGSVEVEQQFTLEHYSEVIHIVSQVGGNLKSGLDCIDVLKAAFPAGTVSGAPKVRAMQVINELEPEARGFYAGCAGYFSANGDMDTAIILRTGLVKDKKLYVQAGAGIVADSIAENEQAECEAKARALFRAAEVAQEIAS
ncbi:MAG: anthranilate synthase component I [Pseudomonadota bacterium]